MNSPVSFHDAHLRSWFRRRLLKWFQTSARDLPWRHTTDPYAIWVSEIMLQQTQVNTVIPYFHTFLHHFPTISELARAEEGEVLRVWEGLGYYRRARHLHEAAKIVVANHGGELPRDAALVSALPGFGRYTVGAVLSQAFDCRLPILEANSIRVLCRFLACREDPRSADIQKSLWHAATLLLPRRKCGEFNQALMELGALLCTPRSPRCAECPLKQKCAAYQTGQQENLPIRSLRAEPIEQQEVAVVVCKDDEVFLVQRPLHGRWAGLWEFPHETVKDGETREAVAEKLLVQLTGIEAKIGKELTTICHGVTRYRITLVCLLAQYRKGAFQSDFYEKGKWLHPARLSQYPLSSPQRKLAQLLVERRR